MIKIWDIETGNKLYNLKGHHTELTCVKFSPDGKHIAAGSKDKKIMIWDLKTGQKINNLKGNFEKKF